MKPKHIAQLLVVAALAMALFAFLPWWSFAGLIQAARFGDTYRMAAYVDAGKLEDNVAEQVEARLDAAKKEGRGAHPFAAIGFPGGLEMARAITAKLASPAAIVHRLRLAGDGDDANRWASLALVFRRVRMRWLGPSAIAVSVRDENGEELSRGRLERSLFAWRLVEIEIPLPAPSRAEKRAVREACAAAARGRLAAGERAEFPEPLSVSRSSRVGFRAGGTMWTRAGRERRAAYLDCEVVTANGELAVRSFELTSR